MSSLRPIPFPCDVGNESYLGSGGPSSDGKPMLYSNPRERRCRSWKRGIFALTAVIFPELLDVLEST